MTTPALEDRSADGDAPGRRGPWRWGEHRYGVVLLLTTAALGYALVAQDTSLGLALRLALQTLTLVVVVAVGGRRRVVHRRRAVAVLACSAAILVLLVAGVVPQAVGSLAAGVFAALAIPALGRGVVALVRSEGVVVRAVFGALAIYLLIGLMFAYVNNTLADVIPGDWFAQGTDGSISDQVYFSFTALTTTGFGDLTAATRLGRSLAVLEMLTGQLYLVTVIGLLVGNLGRRTR